MFDKRETAAILAGLRLLQYEVLLPNLVDPTGHDKAVWAILTDNEQLLRLSNLEINTLCEKINCGGLYVALHHHRHGVGVRVYRDTEPRAEAPLFEGYKPGRADEWTETLGPLIVT